MRSILIILSIVVSIGVTFGACALLGDDPPENTCKSDLECFTNIEQCNLDAGVCEAKPDAPP